MRFDILRNPEAVARKRAELQAAHVAAREEHGQLVRYEMPSMPNAFPKLAKVLQDSDYRKQYLDIYYYIETKDQKLRRLVPAAEYYKFAFRAVADKLYSVRVSFRRVKELEQRIRQSYANTRRVIPATGQPSVRFAEEIYAIKAELAAVLFVARGIPDTVASLFHFLYGPSSRQFTSFADFVKYLRNAAERGEPVDEDMLRFSRSSMPWFSLVRDYRDYVTHTSSIDVALFEDQQGVVRIILQNQIEPSQLVSLATLGVHDLCDFIDEHFSRRIQGLAPGAA